MRPPPPNPQTKWGHDRLWLDVQVFNLSFSADRLEKINILRAAAFVSNCFDWQPLG